MSKSVQQFRLGLYEKSMPGELSLAQKLRAGKEAGFDFMELSVDETDAKLARLQWTKDERRALVAEMYAAEFPISSICLSGHRKYPIGSEDPAVRERGMEIMRAAIDLAFDLGIRIIQIAGYDEYYKPSTARTVEYFGVNLRRSVEYAASKGVILAFETMETEFMNTVGKAMRYVQEIDSPYLQVYPDLGNITNAAKQYQQDVLQDLAAGRGHLAALHLKETVPGKFREIPFGTGHVDFKAGIELAWQLGVRIYLAEFWHVGNPQFMEDLHFANKFLRSNFN